MIKFEKYKWKHSDHSLNGDSGLFRNRSFNDILRLLNALMCCVYSQNHQRIIFCKIYMRYQASMNQLVEPPVLSLWCLCIAYMFHILCTPAGQFTLLYLYDTDLIWLMLAVMSVNSGRLDICIALCMKCKIMTLNTFNRQTWWYHMWCWKHSRVSVEWANKYIV